MGRSKKNYIGIDIGGSKIEIIRWMDGKVLNWRKIKTPKNKKAFLKAVMGAVGEMGLRGVRGIGVAQAGAIDRKTGRILRSPNLQFLDKLNLKKILEKKFHKSVKIANDTQCFLLAEKMFGQTHGKKNVVALTLGTGVGGAVLADGRLLKGTHGAAGELGHMVMGARGADLEDLITADRYDFKKIGKYLGMGLANLVNIFDPELIILGGGVSNDARHFLPTTLNEMKKYTLLPSQMLPQVKVSKLNHASALGAVALFLKL